MLRSLCWLPAIALVLCLTRPAGAQGMSTTLQNGQTLTMGAKIWIHEDNNINLVQPATTPTSLQHYFNYAHCVCSTPGNAPSGYNETTFSQEIDSSGGTPVHIPLELWVGSTCSSDATTRMTVCTDTGVGISDIATLETTGFSKPELTVFQMMEPTPGSTSCQQQVLSATEWGLASYMMNGIPDTFLSNAIDTDSLPPPVPTSFTASGAESAVELDWTAATGNVADIAYYQALCADASGNPAFASAPFSPRYYTPRTLCSFPEDACLNAASVDGGTVVVDAGVVTDAGTTLDAGTTATCPAIPASVPTALAQLDPSYLCGETTDPTATSLRIGNLTNGTPYQIVLLAIDLYGNAAGVYFTSKLTPKPVTDFWEDLNARCTGNNCPQGGFCLLAETYGDDSGLTNALRSFRDETLGANAVGRALSAAYYASAAKLGAIVHGHLALRIAFGIVLAPVVALALVWHALGLPLILVLALGWRFRRRLRMPRMPRWLPAAAASVAALVIAPRFAHAQSPYWEDQSHTSGDDEETESLADQPSRIKWHAGVKIGPYTPGIDGQIGGTSPGPYKQMFGGYSIVPMLDLDRVLWTGFGQLGIGISIGYLGKSANAWAMGSLPTDANRARSSGDTNSFHLIPIQLTAVYRFTYFDDEWGVPLVPYARAGFAYYPWWVTAPDGNFATACPGVGMVANGCASTTAAGASPGIVGAIGLAVRAERIDASAARSMHEGGIEHAGFYAELNAGKVDGLGIVNHKLAVGDATWFAGVDFEF